MPQSNYYLSTLELENFRQYNSAKISFSKDPKKMFTILRGDNGAGKTTIMNAITWCLYGREMHLNKGAEDLPIVSIKALKEKPEGMVTMRVKLRLADHDGDSVNIERKLVLHNHGLGEIKFDSEIHAPIPSNSTPVITSMYQLHKDGGWTSTEYFDTSVNELLPEDLATYFLFDGEKLEEFFDHAEITKKAIEDVSQIKLTERAIDTLDKFRSQLRKSAKGLDPRTTELRTEMDSEKENIKKINKMIEIDNKDHKKKLYELNDAEQIIINAGGDVAQYQEDAQYARNQKEKYQEKRNKMKKEIKKYVLDNMFKLKVLPLIDETLELIRNKGVEGMLPPKIKETFLNEILHDQECICGSELQPGTKSYDKVSALLKKAKYSSIEEICTDLKYGLSPMLNVDKIRNTLERMEKEEISFKNDEEEWQKKYDELNIKIGRTDVVKVNQAQEIKDKLTEEISKLDRQIGENTEKIRKYKEKLESIEREFDSEVRKEGKHKHLSDQIEFCTKAYDGLEKIKNELLDDVRAKVEFHTNKYFLDFLWKKNTYNNVTISQDYRIAAHHIDGHLVRESLSKGEKLVLALSFMSALRKITGFGFPLIIDTPLGRVSGAPRYNIARHLPMFLKDTQVTMLVTDTEYQAKIIDDNDQQKFAPLSQTFKDHVGKDYIIKFNEDVAQVEEYHLD